MAQRRMFSPDIICSEEFLDMPVSARDLYYQLCIRADDDGFIQPRMTMRMVGASADDLKVLLAKRFLLTFESGVVVVKHWLIHNLIRSDRYKGTRFQEEKKVLRIKENKAYTELATTGLQIDNQAATQVRLGKVRLGKVRESAPTKKKLEKREIAYLSNPKLIATLKVKFPKLNVDLELYKLSNWLKSEGKTKKDYGAFATNWMIKAIEYKQQRKGYVKTLIHCKECRRNIDEKDFYKHGCMNSTSTFSRLLADQMPKLPA